MCLIPIHLCLWPVINYEVEVRTGDVAGAGTDAEVFIQIYGKLGKTEVIRLQSRSNNFVRRETEMFKVGLATDKAEGQLLEEVFRVGRKVWILSQAGLGPAT